MIAKAIGGAQPNISQGILRTISIPIAPRAQQERIVAEIEKQFSRLDEAVANLKRVKANLKRYKAAVLKAAVEGKLTEDWRKAHPDIEPAGELLKRILAERRAKWEQAELAKMEAAGKEPKDDKWKKRYQEPDAVRAEELESRIADLARIQADTAGRVHMMGEALAGRQAELARVVADRLDAVTHRVGRGFADLSIGEDLIASCSVLTALAIRRATPRGD